MRIVKPSLSVIIDLIIWHCAYNIRTTYGEEILKWDENFGLTLT